MAGIDNKKQVTVGARDLFVLTASVVTVSLVGPITKDEARAAERALTALKEERPDKVKLLDSMYTALERAHVQDG